MVEPSPLELLESIRQQALSVTADGSNVVRHALSNKNIAFYVSGVGFICDAAMVREVSVCGRLVSVPQTKRWMRGLVNSKGVLYSVTDLSLLAGFDRATTPSKAHLLFINDDFSQCSLLVDRVVGFRYFNDSQLLDDFSDKQEQISGLSAYVDGAYRVEEEVWFRLDLQSLIESEQFREVQ